MKIYHIFALLIAINTQHTTFSMDNGIKKAKFSMDDYWDNDTEEFQSLDTLEELPINQSSTTTPRDKNSDTSITVNQLDSIIDTAIDKIKPKSIVSFFIASSPTEEEISFTTINSIYQYSDFLEQYLITELRDKNKHFRQAIEYFITLAREDLDNVTINTLELIDDSTELQSITQLNKLPAAIKKYVMNYAYRSIIHPYDIILTGHTKAINFFDISAASHHAITSSKLENRLCLWDLTNGKLLYSFPRYADCLTFNLDGSKVAEATNNINGTNISVWQTTSPKSIVQAELGREIREIKYLFYGTNDVLFICNGNQYRPLFATIKFNNELNKLELTSLTRFPINISFLDALSLFRTALPCAYRTRDPYLSKNADSDLTITKLNCPDLYLCQQAVKNSPSSAHLIKNLPVFQKLTEFEQNMICKSLPPKLQQLTGK